MSKPIKTMASVAVIAMMTSNATHAGSFSLYTESSAAAIGNYGAGIAAEGADASIGWYNPAGLVLIKDQQFVFGGVGVFPSVQLAGTSTYTTQIPMGVGPQQYVQSFSGVQGGESALVPSFHYALPLGDRATFGLSVVAPFGLTTDYPNDSPIRYAATRSEFVTVNVSPELGGKLTDNFSIGVGLDLQYASVGFNSMIGSPAYLQFLGMVEPGIGITPTTLDSESKNTGTSFAVGFHVGAMLMFDENHTRIGVNYQSGMDHQFSGKSQLTGRLADPSLFFLDPALANPKSRFTSNSLYSNDIDLPQIVTLSGYRDINDKLALLGSVVYTGWSSFQSIQLNNVAVGVPNPDGSGDVIQTTLNSTTTEGYRDAWRFSLGANYRVTNQWMMRVGGGYDQTPTVTAHRDVRLPDSDRWALSIGTHYQMRPSIGFDLGYTHLFAVNNAVINNTQAIGATSTYNVNATGKSSVDIVGLQVVWTIDQVKEMTK